MLAKNFMKDYECDKTKTIKFYKKILKEYPFCIIKDSLRESKYEFLDLIINNKEFDREQKTLRLIAVFLDLMLEYLGTSNMDIGILTDDYIYKTNKEIINHISISFQFYKDLVQE